MNVIAQLEQERHHVLAEMESIRSLERATLSSQMLPVPHQGKEEPVLRGPYYVLARWQQGKTHSRRVRAEELAQVQQDVANYQRFVALCERFVNVTEQLGGLERAEGAAAPALKKTPRSPSRRTRKSRG